MPTEKGDNYIMQKKHVDISELYDLFKERKDCYFVTCDIKHMIPINAISIKAGDLAILEQMRRLTVSAGEEDIVFRIGGDEFCVLTASNDAAYARQIAEKIRKMNNQTFLYENQEIPLTLHVNTISLKDCHTHCIFCITTFNSCCCWKRLYISGMRNTGLYFSWLYSAYGQYVSAPFIQYDRNCHA